MSERGKTLSVNTCFEEEEEKKHFSIEFRPFQFFLSPHNEKNAHNHNLSFDAVCASLQFRIIFFVCFWPIVCLFLRRVVRFRLKKHMFLCAFAAAKASHVNEFNANQSSTHQFQSFSVSLNFI